MRLLGLFCISVIASGCMQRLVQPPAPIEEGAFYVHVVRQPDETFPKILTWYTGTTLSGSIVTRFNPHIEGRDLKVGDRIVLPVEVMANEQPYGTSPSLSQKETPNLLMGDDKAPKKESKGSPETFDDDTNPMIGEATQASGAAPQSSDQRRKDLEREIRERQAELDRLKQEPPVVNKDADEELPYEGGESF